MQENIGIEDQNLTILPREKRSHRHRSSTRRRNSAKSYQKKSSLETFVAKHLLKIIGVLFFISGTIWMIFKGGSLEVLNQFLAGFFATGPEEITTTVVEGNIGLALLHLSPAVMILSYVAYCKIVNKPKSWFTKTAFYLGAGMLYLNHGSEIIYGFLTGDMRYPSLLTGLIITLILTSLVLFVSDITRKTIVPIVSILLLYFSSLLLGYFFGTQIYYVFITIILFSGLLFFLLKNPSSNSVKSLNVFFAIGYFSLYFLRKLYIKDSPDLVWTYLFFATIAYIVLMTIQLVNIKSSKDILGKIISDSSIYALAVFYFLTCWYTFYKYEPAWMQGVFAILLTLINIALLRFKNKIHPGQINFQLFYSAILVASTIIPLIIQQNKIVLLSATAAILFILLAKFRKNKPAAVYSVLLVSFSFLMLLARTILYYYPATGLNSTTTEWEPFLFNLVSGLLVTSAAWLTSNFFADINFSYSNIWFSKTKTSRFVTLLFYCAFYVTGFWVFQFTFLSLFKSPEAQIISWYYYHISLLLIFEKFSADKDSWFYKVHSVIALASVLLLPVLVNFFFIRLREMSMSGPSGMLISFYLHFVFLLPLIYLFHLVMQDLKEASGKSRTKQGAVLLVQIAFATYLLLAEFDHITVVLNGSSADFTVIQRNHHVPYSMVFYILSLILVYFSYTKKIKFFRQLSLLLLLLVTAKLFVLDFGSMGAFSQALTFWIAGCFLFLYSFIYQKLRKASILQKSS